jgi:NDP-sugar pyrophosphorylase family protein
MQFSNPMEYFLNSELIVHAGGLSERWYEVTGGKIPKPITAVGKKPRPMIDWVILPYVMAGVKEIFISLWHSPEFIIQHCDEIAKNTGIKFVYLKEPEGQRIGRAGVIKYYLENGVLDENKPKISVNSTDIMKINTNEFAKFQFLGLSKGFLASVIVSPSEQSQFGKIRCDMHTKAVIQFVEKPVMQLPKDEYVNTGTFYLDSQLNKYFHEIEEKDYPVDLEKSKILQQFSRQMRCFEHVLPLKTWVWLKNMYEYRKANEIDFERFFEIVNVERFLGPYSPQDSQTL